MRNYFLIAFILLLSCSENHDVPNHTPGVVKVFNNLLMVAYGEGGLIISDEISGEVLAQIFPPQGMNSIDDFDVDGDLIFVLDSRGRDYMAVFSFDGDETSLVSDPVIVEGGPFNGISASNGNLVVSGGTTFLNRFTYSSSGDIQGPISFGRDRGHPDVILSSNGQVAFISADFGIGLDIDRFGVMSLYIGDELEIPSVISELGIADAGLTEGLTTPVGFPIQTALHNDNLIVAHGGGLTIIRLIEEFVFGSSTNIDIGISAISVAVSQDTAYIIGYQDGTPTLVRVDLTDLDNPAIINSETLITNESIPTSIAVGSNDLYIAAGTAGLIILPKS
ncbi:hypothetical protein [Ekhidna sp.]|uniref:hypothetical protein n=1 Tax=Ekhidna sp. TaxID=2608089 RepID=UPI003BADA573